MSPVIIHCPSCQTRFSMNPAILEGSRGARIRCRKCGERFEIRNPSQPPAPEPAVTPDPALAAIPTVLPKPPLAVERTPASEPTVAAPPTVVPNPPLTSGFPARSEPVVAPELAVAVGRAEAAPPPAPSIAAEIPRRGKYSPVERHRRYGSRSRREPSRTRTPGWDAAYYIAGVAAIVLVFCAVLLFHPGIGKDLVERLEGIRTVSGGGPAAGAQRSLPEVRIVSGHYIPNPQGTTFFVLRGAVRDTRKEAVFTPIHLRAVLRNAGNQVLAEKTFHAGIDVPEDKLLEESVFDNMILEEGWIPFVVVFLDPGVVSDYFVTIEPG